MVICQWSVESRSRCIAKRIIPQLRSMNPFSPDSPVRQPLDDRCDGFPFSLLNCECSVEWLVLHELEPVVVDSLRIVEVVTKPKSFIPRYRSEEFTNASGSNTTEVAEAIDSQRERTHNDLHYSSSRKVITATGRARTLGFVLRPPEWITPGASKHENVVRGPFRAGECLGIVESLPHTSNSSPPDHTNAFKTRVGDSNRHPAGQRGTDCRSMDSP